MEKRHIYISLAVVLGLFVVLAAVGFFDEQRLTGFAVLQEGHTMESCENATYVWYNENCYDEQPVCDVDFLELCLTQEECESVDVGGYWYNDECNADAESVCDSSHLTLCDETECAEVGYWYDGLCNVEAEPSCSNDLALCLDETNCTSVGNGYWYDGLCNADAEPVCDADHLSLCNETTCVDAGGSWDGSLCNAGAACVDTCSSLGYDCETWEVCGISTDCGTCGVGYGCVAGVCEEYQTTDDDESDGDDENGDEADTTPEGTSETTDDYYDSTITAKTTQLTGTDISSLTLNPNDTAQIIWSVKNTGTEPVSACKLKPLGDFSSWFLISDETQNLNSGEQKEFTFDIIIPEDSEEGSYILSASVECSETTTSKDLAVEVIKKKLDFIVIDAQRTRATRVRVIYSLEELSGNDQEVEVQFSLLSSDNQEVANASQNRSIDANSTKEFKVNIPVNESLEGNLSLLANFNSEIYSSSIQEGITLGAPIAGFAIFGEGVGTTGSIIILVVIILVLGIVFLIVRKIRKSKRGKE